MVAVPRHPRLYAKDIPCHIVQRGNNRNACFYSAEDYGLYMNILNEALVKYGVKLHAFVLMTNHVHLLMTPADHEGISLVMQYIGRRYVRNINAIYGRTGTLWEGRHKASMIDSDDYLLTCMRYIELNPVRAYMVVYPVEYHWSSYRANAEGLDIQAVTHHAVYQCLGATDLARQQAYRDLFHQPLKPGDVTRVRECLNHNYPLGDDVFKSKIETTAGIRVGRMKQGRPKENRDNKH